MKSRVIPNPFLLGVSKTFGNPNVHLATNGTLESLIHSRGNPKVNGKRRNGGAFWTVKVTHLHTPSRVDIDTEHRKYTGGFVPNAFLSVPGSEDISIPSGRARMKELGPQAFKAFRPDKPIVDLSNFVGELRDSAGLLSMYRGGLKRFSDAWLDFQFGRGALIRDLVAILDHSEKLRRRIDFLIRNSGKWVKTSGTLDITEETQESGSIGFKGSYTQPVLVSQFYNGSAIRTIIEKEVNTFWFDANWRFFLPPNMLPQVPGGLGRLRRKLLGTDPARLEVVWNLMPWTWLVDWYSNIGDTLSNLDSHREFGTVADGAFIMCRTEISEKHIVEQGTIGGMTVSTAERLEVHKMRTPASPYGFDLTDDDLSPSQIATLGALGISRS